MPLPRARAIIRRWLRLVGTVFAFALLGAFAFVLAALFHGVGSVPLNWAALAHVSAVFAILGGLFGTVLALDRSADASPWMSGLVPRFEAPALRTFICAALGAGAVLLVRSWHPGSFAATWAVVGAAVGAALGWFGWRWAKYVDF